MKRRENPKLPTVTLFEIITLEWEHEELPQERWDAPVDSGFALCDIQRTYRMGQRSDICAIGMLTLALNGRGVEDVKEDIKTMFIRPAHSQVSDLSLSKLDTTRDQFEANAISIQEASHAMREGAKSNGVGVPLWMTWGGYGFSKVKSECDQRRCKSPFGNRRVDLKTVASLVLGRGEDLPRKEVYDALKKDMGWDYVELPNSVLERNLIISADIVGWLTPYGGGQE